MILLVLVLAAHELTVSPVGDDARCMACHERIRLVRVDTLPERYEVALTPERYAAGAHGTLSCTACHGEAFATIPHASSPRLTLSCAACHAEDPTGCTRTSLRVYEASMQEDVHLRRLRSSFGCASCHDPHGAPLGRCGAIHESNASCTVCHRPLAVLRAHLWLPSVGLHLRRTGCTACHFPIGERGFNHQVRPAAEALKDCRVCHDRAQAHLFGDRAAAWVPRQVPGWRSALGYEVAALVGLAAVLLLALAGRLSWVESPLQVRGGPGAFLRAGVLVTLLISGLLIYVGAGRMLEPLSHLHVVAGALLLLASAERTLLLSRTNVRDVHWFRKLGWGMRALAIGSGILLLVPTFTPVLDEALPLVRTVHRAAAALIAMWVLGWLVRPHARRRAPPGRR